MAMAAKKSQVQKLADDHRQTAAFRKAARELGCDDNEERFKQALRTVAKAKPSPEKRKAPRARD
jgi:hypothetical protein